MMVLVRVVMMRVFVMFGFVVAVHGRRIRSGSEISKSTGKHGESQKFFHKIARQTMKDFRWNAFESKEICWAADSETFSCFSM